MIHHLVMMRLKDRNDETRAAVRDRLLGMQGKVPQLRHLEVGVDELQSARSWDVCLRTQFDTWDDLAAYGQDPLHKEVLAFIGERLADVAVVDWEA